MMPKANNIIPKMNEEYWTITKGGNLVKTENIFSKSDLFNMMFGFCWDSMNVHKEDITSAVNIIKQIESGYHVQA